MCFAIRKSPSVHENDKYKHMETNRLTPSPPLPHTHTHAHAHVHTHIHTHTRAHTHTHTHVHTHTHIYIYTHARTHAHTHTYTHTHPRIHARVHVHTRTHGHTGTHIHACPHTLVAGPNKDYNPREELGKVNTRKRHEIGRKTREQKLHLAKQKSIHQCDSACHGVKPSVHGIQRACPGTLINLATRKQTTTTNPRTVPATDHACSWIAVANLVQGTRKFEIASTPFFFTSREGRRVVLQHWRRVCMKTDFDLIRRSERE